MSSFKIRALEWVIIRTPLPLLRFCTNLVSYILIITLKRERKIAICQLQVAGISGSSLSIFRKSLVNSVLCVFEGLKSQKLCQLSDQDVFDKRNHQGPCNIPNSRGRVTVEGGEQLLSLLQQNKGCVCLAGHFGSFELMVAYFSLQGAPATVFARKPNYNFALDFIKRARSRNKLNVIWREDTDAGAALMKAIRNKNALCALIDQDIALENSFAPFFGIDAAHPVLPVKIAVRFKLPVFLCNTLRLPDFRYKIIMEEVVWKDQEDPVQFILDTYSKKLEALVRTHPEMWVWWHRRWRRRPGINYDEHPDQLRGTSDYVDWLEQQLKSKQVA